MIRCITNYEVIQMKFVIRKISIGNTNIVNTWTIIKQNKCQNKNWENQFQNDKIDR